MGEVIVVDAEDDVGNSDTPRENVVASDDDNAEETRTIQESCNTGEVFTAVADFARIDDGEAEDKEGTSLDREALNSNNAVGGPHERPGGDECSVEIQSRVESGESVAEESESAETLCESVDLEDPYATTDTIVNMANETPVSVCIEVEDETTEDSDDISKNSDKASTQTTIIYVSEGDNSDMETDLCRICHCGEEVERLISPCMCTGSVKFVHHTCLMSWLQRAVMSKCELCLYPLAVKRKRKSLSKWRLPEDKPIPVLWLLTYVVAMTVNVASLTKDGSQRCVSDPCIIFYVLGSAGALLGLAFFYRWLKKTVRYFARWIALNQEWTLVGPVDLRNQLGQTNLAYSTKSLSETETGQEQIA